MFRIRLISSLFFAFAAVVSAGAQAPEEFRGGLVGLSPDTVHIYQRVFKAMPVAKTRFVPAIEKGATLTQGELIDYRSPAGKLEVFLVEPAGKPPYICADLNKNGTIESKERFVLKAQDGTPEDLDHALILPIDNTPLFTGFPIFVRYKRGFSHPKFAKTDRLILQSVWAHALGTVKIGGKSVQFQYPFDPQAPAISTTEGLFGVDADGDGMIKNEHFSPETSYAANDEAVFRVGDIYLSTFKIDLAKNEIVVRRRSASEYLRVDLEVGKEMPDFKFTDFDGKARSLAEFRGKYVLVDFWGVWCVDCLRETPFHVAAYERFRSRGFEILGLNWDDNKELAQAYLQKNKATWPQATKESIRTLVEVSYRIQEYPSTILLGPDGKVLVLDQDLLRDAALTETLDRLLPR